MSDTDRVTFKEKYNTLSGWQEKAVLISLYHSLMHSKYPAWTITDTAQHFEVSIGLVSENIRLAKEIDGPNGTKISNCETRDKALKMIERRRMVRHE